MPDTRPNAPDTDTPCVQLLPSGLRFAAPAPLTVLQSAEAAGIEMPASCRNGTCRTCLCHLQSGRIRYLIEWPGVSLEERQAGDFLPCVSCAETDLEIVQTRAIKINVT